MPTIRGCNLPEDLYYLIDKHVWARPMEGGTIRVGMTAVAGKLAGGKFVAVTVKSKAIGQEVKQGKSVATVESSKFVGPVPAPVTGHAGASQRKAGQRSQPGRERPVWRRLDRRDAAFQLGSGEIRPGHGRRRA